MTKTAEFLVLLSSSIVLGAVSTWLMRVLARKTGIVARPNPIVPQHTRPVAFLGGMGIGIGILVLMLIAGGRIPLRIALPGCLMLILGTADDLWPFSPVYKFAAQVAVSVTAVLMGLTLQITGSSLLDASLTVLIIVTIVNAFNLTDVCDGLLPLLSIIACLGLALLGSNPWLAIAVAGTVTGFMLWNRPDASIFLGDGGSHLLGFLVTVLIADPVYGSLGGAPGTWRFIAVLSCVALPLYELCFLVVIRTRKGIPWYRGSPDHYALRLQNGMISKWGVLGISAGIGILLCGSGRLLDVLAGYTRYFILALMIATLLVFTRVLLRLESSGNQ